jgi:hypothetical protein
MKEPLRLDYQKPEPHPRGAWDFVFDVIGLSAVGILAWMLFV